jgi:hypothetical protein
MRRKYSRIIINVITILTLIAFFNSCNIRKYPDYYLESNKIQNINKNNVTIGIDVLSDKDRLEKYFGVDLLSEYADHGYAILPIYISIENIGDKPITIINNSISFISQDSNENMTASDGQAASSPCNSRINESKINMSNFNQTFFIAVFFPIYVVAWLVVVPIHASAIATDKSIAASILSKSLREKSIYKNQKNSGFVYFLITYGDMEKLRNTNAMHLYIKDIDTHEKIEFRFSINSSNILNSLKELGKKPKVSEVSG